MNELIEESKDDFFESGICFAPIDIFERWKSGELYFKEDSEVFLSYEEIVNTMKIMEEDGSDFDDFCCDNNIFEFDKWDDIYREIGLMTFYKEVEPFPDEKVMMFGYVGYNC